MVGGAVLQTGIQTLLVGTTLPYAFLAVFFELIILVFIIDVRERRA